MERLQGKLAGFLNESGMVGVIIARANGEEIIRAGDFGHLKWGGLLSTLFGGTEEVKRLAWSLEEQLLPRLFSQGDEWCIASRCDGDIVWGVFVITDSDGVAMYHRSKDVAQAIEQIIKQTHLQDPVS
jgi:hypothetical protein